MLLPKCVCGLAVFVLDVFSPCGRVAPLIQECIQTFVSGEGNASLCLEWECDYGSAMDCCKFCTPRGLAAPYQTGSLQWQLRVTGAGMAGNDSGIGSGWQQSKQN